MQTLKKGTFIRRFLKVLLITIAFCLAIALFLFAPIDRKDWRDKEELYQKYQTSLQAIIPSDSVKGKLKAGWAKISILPSEPIPIASYGIREKNTGVHDSLWCRAVVLDNGIRKVAMVTIDLLIFPPALTERLQVILKEKGYPLENTYFSATHTHNAPGGWAEKLGGRFLAGKYNEDYVEQLTKAVVESIELAEADLKEASIGFGRYEAKELIENRFSNKAKDLDHWLRLIKIQKVSGENALIVSYAAHPTILSSTINELSGDYAGALVNSLEKDSLIDFAAFYAGAVGAHVCRGYEGVDYEAIKQVSDYLKGIALKNFNSIEVKDSVRLHSFNVPVYLDDPQLKVSPNWKLRPWVFHFLLGKQSVFLSALRIEDMVFIGTPCDFGGELLKHFSEVSEERKLKLVITSFNGGYIGYIVPDEYYDLPLRESRDMSWYGPHNADYFTELIREILKKI